MPELLAFHVSKHNHHTNQIEVPGEVKISLCSLVMAAILILKSGWYNGQAWLHRN